jgi:hypothetical protein
MPFFFFFFVLFFCFLLLSSYSSLLRRLLRYESTRVELIRKNMETERKADVGDICPIAKYLSILLAISL